MKKGFTLIELLVVVAIVGILAITITSALNSARVKARESRFLLQVKSFKQALELYNIDNGRYPASWNHSTDISWVRICADGKIDETDSDLQEALDEYISVDYVDAGDTAFCMQYRGWGSSGSPTATFYYETACGVENPWPYTVPDRGKGYLLMYTTNDTIIEEDHWGTYDGLHWHCTHNNK